MIEENLEKEVSLVEELINSHQYSFIGELNVSEAEEKLSRYNEETQLAFMLGGK